MKELPILVLNKNFTIIEKNQSPEIKKDVLDFIKTNPDCKKPLVLNSIPYVYSLTKKQEKIYCQFINIEDFLNNFDEKVNVDSLTGLYNKNFFDTYLNKIKNKRNLKFLSLFLIDIDQFKSINDSYGHLFGDELLKIFSKKLKSCCREEDLVFRWAGDEFSILLEKGEKEAIILAERICSVLNEKIKINNIELKIKVSIGISTYVF